MAETKTIEDRIDECRVQAGEFMNYRFVLKRLSSAKEDVISFEDVTMEELIKEASRWAIPSKTIVFTADEAEIDEKLLHLNQLLSKTTEIADEEMELMIYNPNLYHELADMDHIFNGISILWKLNHFQGGLKLNG